MKKSTVTTAAKTALKRIIGKQEAALAIAFVACFCLPAHVFAQTGTGDAALINSAIRFEGEDYLEAMSRSKKLLGKAAPAGSAVSAAVPYVNLDLSKVPVVDNLETLVKSFNEVRDIRFLISPAKPEFLRRMTWMYPDDGCFARAAMMGKKLQEWNYVRPGKVFVFGNLKVKTAYSKTGEVGWWYHVVPIVKVGEEAYVYDPAIVQTKPLPLKDWLATMGSDIGAMKVSVCTPTTYSPYDNCLDPRPEADASAESDQKRYLAAEWDRLVSLKMDPEKLLGNEPPWLAPVPVAVPAVDVAAPVTGKPANVLVMGLLGNFSFDGGTR